MTYWPSPTPPMLPMVGNLSHSPGAIGGGASSSTAWPSANRAIYTPILLGGGHIVRRLWWANGATVSASYNIDCGIYADGGYKPGALIVSTGSTAQGTASQVQFVDVTDTVLAPGLYWMGFVISSASSTVHILNPTGASNLPDIIMGFQQTSALPLPATATVAEQAGAQIPHCGFSTIASP